MFRNQFRNSVATVTLSGNDVFLIEYVEECKGEPVGRPIFKSHITKDVNEVAQLVRQLCESALSSNQ